MHGLLKNSLQVEEENGGQSCCLYLRQKLYAVTQSDFTTAHTNKRRAETGRDRLGSARFACNLLAAAKVDTPCMSAGVVCL